MRTVLVTLALLLAALLASCSGSTLPDDTEEPGSTESSQADGSPGGSDGTGDTTEAGSAEVGQCRVLTTDDIASSSNDTEPVDCSEPHTAETFAVGDLPDDAAYDDPGLADAVYPTCQKRWMKFTGADDSLALRSVLTWAWFRPSEAAWDEGDRSYRCDVVGGLDSPDGLVELPKGSAKGVLLGIPPDRWMTCVQGGTVEGAPGVPCTEPHDWRAVSTIVIPRKKYPGDQLVEVLARDFCSKSVIAWLDYPPQYDYAYTAFGEAEWEAGNRRAVCWARTDA